MVDQAPAVGIHHAPRARVDDCLYVPAPMQVGAVCGTGVGCLVDLLCRRCGRSELFKCLK